MHKTIRTTLRRSKMQSRALLSKTVAIILLLMAGLVSACEPSGPVSGDVLKKSGQFKVVTSFTILADMARNVGGARTEVVSITRPGADIHNYQPTPGDIVAAQDAKLILWNGLNLELWFEKFFQNLKNVPSVTVSDGVKPISIAEGPYQGKPNAHAWMSPENALIYVDNMVEAFARYDPDGAALYRKNGEAYKAKIMVAAKPLRAALEALPEDRRWLVTSEGAFSYLAADFGLKELYLWPTNADAQGTPQQMRRVIEKIRKHKIGVVFSESTVSANPAMQLVRETGAFYGGVLYVDSLSGEDGKVPDFLSLLEVTITTIANGLSEQSVRSQTALQDG